MTLDHQDLLRLSRIAESLRRTDPELARQLSRPLRPSRPPWNILATAILFACGLLSLIGLVIGDTAIAVAGCLPLLTVYPLLLVLAAGQRMHPRPQSTGER